ncbi:hypothetical protein FRC09_019300, partial [Ceratobasidium sp. 395]
MPAAVGNEVLPHGTTMNVEDAGHYVAVAGFSLVSTARQQVFDWVNSLFGTIMTIFKTFGNHLLLLSATLLGAGGQGGLGVQRVDAQQYLLGLGIGD